MRKLKKALGQLLCPALILGYRVTKSRNLLIAAVKCDPANLTGLEALAVAEGREIQGFRKLFQATRVAAELAPVAIHSLIKNLEVSEAQFLQDLIVLAMTGEKKEGFFVEVGVGDGKVISNTYILEKYYHWKGILVEPNRRFFQSIQQNRDVVHDKRAAFKKTGVSLVFNEVVDDQHLSSVSQSVTSNFPQENMATYSVDAARLEDILSDYDSPDYIDFLSIDTEGSEVEVLSGVDFTSRRFGTIVVEHNNSEAKKRTLIEMLSPYGYIHILERCSHVDIWFAHKDFLAERKVLSSR
ncbi:MAG: FkbM family methyltransferase [Mesorhizobium sp.]|nr:MAG: FkbM family methyltransferase [Mesorhizobium sp.]